MNLHPSPDSSSNLAVKTQQIHTISPTGLRQAYGCVRAYLLGSVLQVYQREDNVHFQFGNAYGAGCAAIAQHFTTKGEETALAYGVVEALAYLPLDADFKGKNWNSLYKQLKEFCDVWKTYQLEGWEFVSTEVKVKTTGALFFSGTFDLLLYNTVTGLYRIVDLKTTGSDFYYNWESEHQVMFYTFLQYLNDIKLGRRRKYEAGEYLVAIVTESELALKSVQLTPAFCVDTLRSMVSEANRIQSEVQAFCKAVSYYDFETAMSRVPANPKECRRGNFTCNFSLICHGGAPAYVSNVADMRRPSAVVNLEVGHDDVVEAINRMTEDLREQIVVFVSDDPLDLNEQDWSME